MNVRRFYDSGKAVERALLPLRSSALHNAKSLPPSLRILRQLRLRHLWGFQAWWNSLERRPRRHLPRITPHARVQSLPFPHLPRHAFVLSDFTIADSLDDQPILEPEIITPHDIFYLDDGSVEAVYSKTLFRVHAGALLFHSPVLHQMSPPANLTTAESFNGCPRVVSSGTPTHFATLLKAIYLPG